MLILAGIALVLPAAYRSASGAGDSEVARLSVWISLVLHAAYVACLTFSRVTHTALFAGSHGAEQRGVAWSVGRAAGVLADVRARTGASCGNVVLTSNGDEDEVAAGRSPERRES